MERLWSRSFIQLILVAFLLFTSLYLLLPTLPLYIVNIGGNESIVGLAAGAFTLSAVVFRPIVGGLVDRYGRRSFILWGLVFFAISMVLYDWAIGIALLLALRVFHGVSWAFSTTGVGTAVTDIIPADRRGEGMGWFGLAMTVAMAIGPILGIWVMDSYSFQNLFLVAAILAAGSLLLMLTVKLPVQPKAPPGRVQLFEKSVMPVTATCFFLAVVYGGITTFLPLFAESLHVNAGTFFLIYALTLTLIRPVAGKLSDRYGEVPVIIPSLVITAAALLVLSIADGLTAIIVSAILYGIGFGSAQPALQAANLRLAPPDKRGVATASFMTAFDLGIGLGSIALGWFSQYAGFSSLFTVSAMSVGVSLLVFVIFAGRLLSNARKQNSLMQ